MLKGYPHLEQLMLGDSQPWILPALVFSLFAWIWFGSIERFAMRKGTSFWKNVVKGIGWFPPLLLAIMVFSRFSALYTHDKTHIEIAKYLSTESFSTSDLKLLFTGDGGIEVVMLCALLFARSSEHLPSLSSARSDLRQNFRNRVMMFVASFALAFSTLFFPEQAYTAPLGLPMQPIAPIPGWENFVPLALLGGLLMFGGELFAVSTLFLAGPHFQKLASRARLKVVVLGLASITYLTFGMELEAEWLYQLHEQSMTLPLVLALHLGVCFAIVHQPAVRTDAELNHGEGRSLSILVLGIIMAVGVVSLTALHFNQIDTFGTDLGPTAYSIWISSIAISSFMMVQFLPALGFDAAPRPELWWMKTTLMYTPVILCMFTPFAVLLVPAVWIVLPWSSIVSWFIERDVTAPSKSFVLYPMVVSTLGTAALPFAWDVPFVIALWAGWIPGAIASIGLRLHLRSLRSSRGKGSQEVTLH